MSTSVNLHIHIRRGTDATYEVTADEETVGRAGPESLHWQSLADGAFQARLAQLMQAPETGDAHPFRVVGETLFSALFQGQVLRLFTGIYDQSTRQSHSYLRIRLDIDERAPEIADLPWEFLYWRDAPLATQVQTLLVRQWLNMDYGPIAPLAIVGQPKVLLVIPAGSGLMTDREREIVADTLHRAGMPYQILEGSVSVQQVEDALAGGEFHILHFIGHGAAAKAEDGTMHGFLAFNARSGPEGNSTEIDWVDHERIQVLLSPHASLRLVILNACEGARTSGRGPAGSGSSFIGLVPSILRAGVPAVIAMQYPIRDDVALQFADTFYRRLTAGRWAGHVDLALTLARGACYLNFPNDRGFATPVLFLRAQDGHLFDTAAPVTEPRQLDVGELAREALDRISAHLTHGASASEQQTGSALLSVLRAAAQSRPSAQEALADLAKMPEDLDAQAAARLQLKKLLAKQPATAREVKHLLDVQKSDTPWQGAGIVAGDRSIVGGKGVKISGNVITGDIGGSVTIGGPRS